MWLVTKVALKAKGADNQLYVLGTVMVRVHLTWVEYLSCPDNSKAATEHRDQCHQCFPGEGHHRTLSSVR